MDSIIIIIIIIIIIMIIIIIIIIYLTYNLVNKTTKYNNFVYSDTFRLEWVIVRLWLEPYVFTS